MNYGVSMRFKIKRNIDPKPGDFETKTHFAWKPIEIEGYWVWLERYEIRYVWFKPMVGDGRWVETGKFLIHWYV